MSELNIQDFLNMLLGIIGLIVSVYLYQHSFRKYKPDDLGRDSFERVAKFKSLEWRKKIEKKGITRNGWQKILDEQVEMFEEELKRRGIDPNKQ